MSDHTESTPWLRPVILLITSDEQGSDYIFFNDGIDREIVKVSSGRAALHRLEFDEAALMILDLDLSMMDILETARQARRFPNGQFLPLLFIAKDPPPPEILIKVYEMDGADFTLKSLPPFALWAKIKLLLELRAQPPQEMTNQQSLERVGLRDKILDQIFHESPAAMCLTVGPNHIFEKVNRKFYENTGLTSSVVGKAAREAMPELEGQGIVEQLDHVYQTGEFYAAVEVPVSLQSKDGQRREAFFDLSLQPLINNQGQVYAILYQGVDVTEKVMSRLALKRSNRIIENERHNLRNLFRQMPELVLILQGPEHVFEFINDAYIKVLGFDPTGMTVRQAQPQSVEVHLLLDEIYQTGNTVNIQDQAIPFADRLRYFNLTYSPCFDEAGQINGVIIFGIEVTEQVLSRRALEFNQMRFQQLADSMPQMVYVSNPDGSVKFLNEGWHEYTGTYEEILGTRSTIDLIHPDDWPRCSVAWEKAKLQKTRFESEIRLRSKTGEYRWFITRAVPNIVNGVIVEWFGTSTDIHDQKLAAAELTRSRERYRIVFEDSPVPMWIFYPDSGQYSDVNNAALKTYGYMRSEFLKLNATDILPSEDVELFWQTMREMTFTQGGFLHTHARHKRKDGSIIHMEVTMRDLMLEGRWLRIAAMVDVTKRIAAEEQLRQLMQKLQIAKEEAERANQLKSAFLANMSHEIRTPLGALLGFADLLQDPNLSREEHSNYINILMRNGEQLSIIINDILDLSKVEAGHLTLEFIEVEPQAIVKDILSLLEIKAREKNLTLQYDADPSTPESLTSDPVRMRQVLLNLISNAIKFTHQGRIHVRSYGNRSPQGQNILGFEITDTGIGIPPDQLDRIFEMFVQADGSMTRRFGGTGLGLALSRKLARALGGDVKVLHSAPNEGSTFLFTLADRPELRRQQDQQTSEEPPIPVQTLEQGSLEGVKILIVDDAPDIRSLIAFLLIRAGAIVDFAENGLEGYRKALSTSYDLVLMDIQMPQMDGYTATMKLREQGYDKPIIALTAHVMTEARKKCLSVGCTGHLPKPINPNHLLGIVAYHVKH